MQHPDEGTIHAWIDGQLTADESAALEAHLEECAECSALAAEARGLAAASSRIVSALDIVPGDVIPKAAPRRRPWYASTQLRAAAAVVIVAGASMLVMRDRGVTKMARVMETSAPQIQQAQPAAEPEMDKATVQSAPAPAVAANPVRTASKNLEKKKSEPRQEMDQRAKAMSDAPMAQAPGKAADAVATASVLVDSAARRRFNPEGHLNEVVVVTGVAAAATVAPAQPKILRTDSTANATVYEASPGVEVTLVDLGPRMAFSQRAAPMAQSKERQAAAPPPVISALSKAAVTNSITWTDKRGHHMTLTGPVSTEALEAFRKRLPLDRR